MGYFPEIYNLQIETRFFSFFPYPSLIERKANKNNEKIEEKENIMDEKENYFPLSCLVKRKERK